nr:protein Mpv17-like [Leptinotarsa decemlineata]
MSKSGGLLNIYRAFEKRHMVLNQSLRSGVLIGSGDFISQTCIEKKKLGDVDFGRTCRVFAVGAMLVGPHVSGWYIILSKMFGTSGPVSAFQKIAADQLMFAPYILAVTMAGINTLEGHGWEFTKEQMNLKYTDILLTGYKLWPAVQLINFNFVPVKYQVLVVQCVGVMWNTFLCWKAHQGVNKI